MRLTEYAAKNGFDAPDELLFDDAAKSGTIPIFERPGGRVMRYVLERQPACKDIAVTHPDRLGRDTKDGLDFLDWCEAHKITIHFLDYGGDALKLGKGDPTGRIMLTMIFAMSEYFVKMQRAKIQHVLDAKRTQGLLTGTVPYGKTKIPTATTRTQNGPDGPVQVPIYQIVDCPEEQHWIRQMWAWRYGPGPYTEEHFRKTQRSRLTGTAAPRQVPVCASLSEIARKLNDQGVPTKISAGTLIKVRVRGALITQPATGQWQPGNVKNVLENSHTIALIQHDQAIAKAA
jgi:DNA invertase Pin-like site-specific DNA recombinase